MNARTGGFTLIEILVVIAIIGVLSSVVLASLNTARVKAADAQRIVSLKEIQSSLELFYSINGRYPGPGDGAISAFNIAPYSGSACGYQNDWCDFEVVMKSHIGSLPKDTAGALSGGGRYVYKRNSSHPELYGLAVSLDAANAIAQNDDGFYAQVFELGPLVTYCKSAYAGSNSNWMAWDSSKLCVGGN